MSNISEHEAMYLIRATTHHYVGTITNRPNPQYFGAHFVEWGFDDAAPIVPFKSLADARAAIDSANEETYLMGNGECSRPDLVAVRVTQAPAHVQDRI